METLAVSFCLDGNTRLEMIWYIRSALSSLFLLSSTAELISLLKMMTAMEEHECGEYQWASKSQEGRIT